MVLKIFRKILKFFKKLGTDEVTVYSAQASYYIIISSFPFAMLLISLIGFFMPEYKHTVLTTIQSAVPSVIKPLFMELADELFTKSISIVSFTAITSMWTSSRGLASVEKGISRVYGTKMSRNFFVSAVRSIVYTIVFMFLLMLTLVVHVFSNTLLNMFGNYVMISPTGLILIRIVAFFAFVSVVFALMYYVFSNRRIPFAFHLPGALFSAAGWMIFSNLFSVYIENFANYSYIYGSLAAVVLLMLWLFCCVTILLTGAQINHFIIKREVLK